ncbi:MAG: ABC transporter ATP-binding protein [Prevotella sp.]|jgi:iron complex transport system ATP-binding protein
MAQENTLTLHQLTIGHGSKKTVAKYLNATLLPDRLTCLIGPNGVGKSTLLRTLAGFLPPLSGEVLVEEKPISDYSNKELSRRIGVVLTSRHAVHNMTVEQLVEMGRAPYTGFWGSAHRKDRAAVDEALQLVGIAHLRTRMMETLSDGERQKAMIAKALAQQTSVILLDEPTAFLDFPSKAEVMRLLHRIARESHKTVLLSTHDMTLALQMADELWLMGRDKNIVTGSPEDLALEGKLENFFDNKSIGFDRYTGLFQVNNTVCRTVRMEGRHGDRFAMVRKALLRNGIKGGKEEESEDCVEVFPSEFVYRKNGRSRSCNTVEELLHHIIQDS